MRLKSIKIKNFRKLIDVEINLGVFRRKPPIQRKVA